VTARRRGGVAACAALLALALAPVAAAHSVLLSTTPANDAVVQESPAEVMLTFNEPIETALGSVRVYDGEGEQVDSGEILKPEPELVGVAIDRELEDGTYTVAWRVISADADPIHGAFVFHVGMRGAAPEGIVSEVDQGTPFSVSFAYDVFKFLEYALILLGAGATLVLALALESAAPALQRRLRRLAGVLVLGLVPVAACELVVQGAAAGGFTIGEALDWDVVSAVADTRFGEATIVRAWLAVVLAVFLLVPRARSRAVSVVQVALALALIATPVVSGHSSVSGAVSVVADYAHVLAASAWTGGLAFVVLALVLARADRWPLAARCVPRFSTLAVGSVGVLVVAGAINGYVLVGSWSGLFETEYGLLLVAKVLLVLPLLALGAYNNRFAVPRLRAHVGSALEQRRFLQTAGTELAIMTAIVGVTAVLVNAPPAKSESEMQMHAGGATATLDFGDMAAHVAIDPAGAGANTIEVELEGEAGAMAEAEEVVVLATLEEKSIGPLRYEAEEMEPGMYMVEGADLSIAGDWQLRVEVSESEFEQFAGTVVVPIMELP
jgi:copper transport protein